MITNNKTRTPYSPKNGVAIPTEDRPAIVGLTAITLALYLDIAGPDQDDLDLLEPIINASIEACVQFSGYEPATRSYQFRYDTNEPYYLNITRHPLVSVSEVKAYGEILDAGDYDVDNLSNPPRIALKGGSVISSVFSNIEIVASIGAAICDPQFKLAALAMGAYIYQNRGCSSKDAFSSSGASDLLKPLRIRLGGL